MSEKEELSNRIREECLRKGSEKIVCANIDAYRMYSAGKEAGAYIAGYSKGLADGVELAIIILSDLVKEAQEARVTYTVKGVSN